MAIARKPLENTYKLQNRSRRLTEEEVNRALNDPEYMMGNFTQIVNKGTQTVPFAWNDFQREVNKVLLPLVDAKTRSNRKHYVVIVKPRQVGATTGNIGIWNNVLSYAEGINNLSLLHILPVQGTISTLARDKVEPILTGCLKGDAEVMTKNGWVKFDDYNGEEILVGDGENSWFEKPREVVHYYNDEGLIEYSRGHDYYHLSTKGHRMVYKRDGKVKIKEAWEGIPADGCHNTLVVTTKLNGEGIDLSDDMLRLAIAIQADGHYDTTGAIIFQFAKVRKIERLKTILDALGLKYSEYYLKNGKNCGQCKIRISSTHPISNYKRLPFEWVYKSTLRQKNLLINEIKQWDGYISPTGFAEYYTIDEYQAIWVNTLAKMSGIYSSLVKREINKDNCHDIYRVTFPNKRDKMTTQHLNRQDVPYAGQVHCVSVSSTMFWCRINGCISLTGNTHPNLYPTIYKKNDNGTIVYEYNNIKGNKRNNFYQLVSSNTKAIRGTTNHIVLFDEVAFYNRPEELEAAVLPSIPDYGFSLVVYLSTFEDNKNAYFLNKIKTAIENPDDYTLIFVPWYKIYPEAPDRREIDFETIPLTDYDKNTIIPELKKAGLPRERWGDAISWYHRTLAGFSDNVLLMKKEYPTTLNELVESNKSEPVFSDSAIAYQKTQIMNGGLFTISEDIVTKKPELKKTDASNIRVFRRPRINHRYMLAVDPITAVGESTDNFAATMMDSVTNEQVATIHGRGIALEDWAQYSVGLCKIYNNAFICPETNVGGEFVAFVKSLGYYRFYYESTKNRANKIPGIRTTVGSKERMIRRLAMMLNNESIVLHDRAWIDELEHFELKKKIRQDQTMVVKMEAHKGYHDDCIMSLAQYVGTLTDEQLTMASGPSLHYFI